MKVAFLTHEPFYPPSGGGSAEAIYVVEELVRRGHHVHVFCPRVPDAVAVERQFSIRLHLFSTWRMGRYTRFRTAKYLLYPFVLERLVRRVHDTEAFDLILSQHAISAVAAGRLKRTLRIVVITNFLDYLTGFMEAWPPLLAPPPLLNRLKQFELALPRKYGVDGVLAVSTALADRFAAAGFPRERIQPIQYGFDAGLFPFRPPGAERTGPNPVIVMHGSLDHHHLRDIAAGAVRTVSAARPDATFKIVGQRTGALDQFLKRMTREAPQARFHCTGFVPYHQVAAELASSAIGIVPYEESAGTHCAFVAKVVEYLGVGLPVVCTRLESIHAYFKQERMVRFSSFNGAEFGREILEWLRLDIPELAAQARAASDLVRSELDWRAISRSAIDFVEQTAALRRNSMQLS